MSLRRLKKERGLYAFADAFRQVTGMRGRRSSIDGLISSKKFQTSTNGARLSATQTHTQKKRKKALQEVC